MNECVRGSCVAKWQCNELQSRGLTAHQCRVYRASGNKMKRSRTRMLFACPDTIGPSGP
jgi:hypothetical protein